MPYKDPEKRREYSKKWMAENRPPKSKESSYQKRKGMVKSAKDKPCEICKVKYDPCVMDLHHLDPSQKDGMVAHIMKSGSFQSLQEEIEKCVPLCANCHRLLHNGLALLP